MTRDRRVESALPLDLDLTFGSFARGRHDPCTRRDGAGVWWRSMRTPLGAATLRLRRAGESVVLADAFGPGAEWALEVAPDLVGANDSLEGWRPTGLLAELDHRFPGLRIPRARTVFQCLVPTILEQKVAGLDALRSFSALTKKLGEPAPGSDVLFTPPPPRAIAALPSYEQRALGIDGKRGGTLVFAAKRADRLDALANGPLAEAKRLLLAMPGIGPWTYAEVARVALGDADAVSVGDFHLPNLVTFNLAGEPRGDDARMLELLAPFEGHRARALLLLGLGGRHAPRYGPRTPLRKFALPK